ncbi:glycogen debranching N-terminal domain-containing protein [Arthrobacter sp. ZGTC131]|uniref:glycogen debranching N-terminal domain-containing protein n=1 Tax=Arthrobacter sp. ZGTC131 TaxID=2058898 RepID=UPI000CE510D5|nr:glycogen debranching N-terminal domain-containing protein [Arthrobacter sp. ZGTC131]
MSVQLGLHRQYCSVAAPTQLWLDADGRLSGGSTFSGLLHGDTRMLCQASVTVNGLEPEQVSVDPAPGGVLRVRGLIWGIAGQAADPAIEVLQTWTVTPGVVRHTLRISTSLEELAAEVAVEFSADFTDLANIRLGRFRDPQEPAADDTVLRWHDDSRSLTVSAPGSAGSGRRLVWRGTAGRGRPYEAEWQAVLDDHGSVLVPAAPASLTFPSHAVPTGALHTLLENSLDELDGLRLATRQLPDAPFIAAGAPWYFTLFGRSSLWTARMLLPLDAALSAGTLRVLAEFQGTESDPEAAQEPGKILHELRSKELVLESEGLRLPPRYFGAVDSTLLWLCLLAELWHTGKEDDVVRALLPNARRAVEWLLTAGSPDGRGTGFLTYLDTAGNGLRNQGWKDSAEALQFRDGRRAGGPIALAEVQGYAYQAALAAAELFEATAGEVGDPVSHALRDFASGLQQRFRERFWVVDGAGSFPAMALDGSGTPLDVPASNMGHLLGTDLLSPEEARLVADRLLGAELYTGYGLRTMSNRAAGFWPYSYHCGSVWTHDTAIAIRGLLAEGFTSEARTLAEGLLTASESFGNRLPGLFAGVPASQTGYAVPFPASCRPQNWSSAAAVVVAQALGALA